MNLLFHQLINSASETRADTKALSHQGKSLTYAELRDAVESVAAGLQGSGLQTGDRVAVYLPKQEETVIAFFAISHAGGILVPVNPVLKPAQVAHILSDCGASMLITSKDRLKSLADILPQCKSLKQVIMVDSDETSLPDTPALPHTMLWQELLQKSPAVHPNISADDSVAILYTSGSTGKPKGVVLSHNNLVTGAQSVSQYLEINQDDRILALLPFSFDYGLSQLTTTFHSGACVVLMNYLLPQDVARQIVKEAITGLAAVPSLWSQLATLNWPEAAQQTLRFITNSGSTMPKSTLEALQRQLPKTDIFLMYGLTEAFRSTYLPPEELPRRPTSIGKAVPNATLSVVRPDGGPCDTGEPGELVHSGPLVAKGYWNNPEKTAKHFRPLPGGSPDVQEHNNSVWSGDTVTMDEDGFLYFVGREDDMIKTSGYRVSPAEIEDAIHETGLVREVVVFGVPHPTLGQAIVAVVVEATMSPINSVKNTPGFVEDLLGTCNKILPMFMMPAHIAVRPEIPKTPHGKIDRKYLSKEMQDLFTDNATTTNVANNRTP